MQIWKPIIGKPIIIAVALLLSSLANAQTKAPEEYAGPDLYPIPMIMRCSQEISELEEWLQKSRWAEDLKGAGIDTQHNVVGFWRSKAGSFTVTTTYLDITNQPYMICIISGGQGWTIEPLKGPPT